MDLIRELLFKFETHDDWLVRDYNQLKIPSYNAHVIRGHIALMFDSGLVTKHKAMLARRTSSKIEAKTRTLRALRLTDRGHDFLDSVRDERVWRQVKKAAGTAGGFSIELLGDIAKGFIKTQVKKQTGIEL